MQVGRPRRQFLGSMVRWCFALQRLLLGFFFFFGLVNNWSVAGLLYLETLHVYQEATYGWKSVNGRTCFIDSYCSTNSKNGHDLDTVFCLHS